MSKYHARGLTVLVKPSGVFAFPDIQLQWRPSRQQVTTSDAHTRVYAPERLFRQLRSKGTTTARVFEISREDEGWNLGALPRDQRGADRLPTRGLIRVIVRQRKCALSGILAHNGTVSEIQRLDHAELYSVPLGATIRLALSDGRTIAVEASDNPRAKIVSHDDEWQVAAKPDHGPERAPERHAERGRQKSLKEKGSRRGRHFRRPAKHTHRR